MRYGNEYGGGGTTGGIGFFSLLGILFIALKLTNVIDWPWWVVLAPIWGPIVLVVVIFTIIYVYSKASNIRR